MMNMTAALVRCAVESERSASIGWPDVAEAHGRLIELRDTSVDSDLSGWADTDGSSSLVFPLIGLGRSAATYPALLWNGVRLARADLGILEAFVLVGLAARTETSTPDDLLRAVRAGSAVNQALEQVLDGSDLVGVPTAAAIAAAACAGVMGSTPSDSLGSLLDLAAGLMVVGGGNTNQPDLSALLLGHSMAAGWLAPRVAGAGIVPMPEAVEHTLDVYASNLTVGVTSLGGEYPSSGSAGPVSGDIGLADLVSALV